jgi:hypothetical protein
VGLVRENPAFRDSARVLGALFKEGKIGECVSVPDLCTEALQREIRLAGRGELNRELREAELVLDFPRVEQLFRVIDQPTVTAVVDLKLQHRLETGAPADWRELQQLSVQVYASRALDFALRDFAHFPGLKGWTLGYDPFLGYMAGVLPLADAQQAAFIV